MIVMATRLIAGLLALYEIINVTGIFNRFNIFIPTPVHLSISLMGVILLIYLGSMDKASHYSGGRKAALYTVNILMMIMGVLGTGFVIFSYKKVIDYGLNGYLDSFGMVFAILLAITMLEAVRRLIGIALPIIIVLLMLLTYFQDYLPGALRGQGTPLDTITFNYYVGTSGIFGVPFHIAVNVLLAFLLFGSLFNKSGAGKWLMDISIALTGRSVGGPAKACVVGSALIGTISGSVGGNVATVGNFTIPLMKRIGYSPAFAGGVEATASTGGAILPPVMGAVAFVMAEFLGVPYFQIAAAAAIPASIYFLVLLFSVHFRAKNLGLGIISKDEVPSIKQTMKNGWYYLLPVAALLFFLFIARVDVEIAAFASIPFIIGASFLNKNREVWLSPKRIWEGLIDGIQSWLSVAFVTAAVGMLIGSLVLSGLGNLFADFIIQLGGGNLLLTLILVGIASLILGMGLDAVPAYLTLVVLTAPALVNLGLTDLQAHMYIMYWGLASFITPPVCIAVYVACGISGSKLWETGWEAIRIGAALFLIPFSFALDKSLLGQGDAFSIISAALTAIIGAVVLASALQGYSLFKMNVVQRIIFAFAALMFLSPQLWLAGIGVLIVALTLLWQRSQAHTHTVSAK